MDRGREGRQYQGRLDAQIPVPQLRLPAERGRIARPLDASPLDDVMAIGDSDQHPHIFVNDQDRQSSRLECGEAAPYLLAHQRRQAFGGLVQDEQMRVGDQEIGRASCRERV